jgi:hypothetical protein
MPLGPEPLSRVWQVCTEGMNGVSVTTCLTSVPTVASLTQRLVVSRVCPC